MSFDAITSEQIDQMHDDLQRQAQENLARVRALEAQWYEDKRKEAQAIGMSLDDYLVFDRGE